MSDFDGIVLAVCNQGYPDFLSLWDENYCETDRQLDSSGTACQQLLQFQSSDRKSLYDHKI